MIYYVNLERVVQFEFAGEIEVPDHIDPADKQAVRDFISDAIDEYDCDREQIKNRITFEECI